jgi:GDP-L-fucose synthase
MLPDSKIYVAGHNGLAGSAICRELQRRGFTNILGCRSAELDLSDKLEVDRFFDAERPENVFLAAAKVGGIKANNDFPGDFLFRNLSIQNNVIDAARRFGVRKLLFLGSSCIYPKLAPQPLKEDYLLTGPLEPTNEWYAIAKIVGIKLCQAYRRQHGCDFISAMPTNLYGPGDNYDPLGSHVLPALIRRFHEVKESQVPFVTCWGTGTPLREFLHSDDLGRALVLLMRIYSEEQFINVGSGTDLPIRELAETVARLIGYRGEIRWDSTKPDGPPCKLMDSSRLRALGWRAKVPFEEGISWAYRDFLDRERRVNSEETQDLTDKE